MAWCTRSAWRTSGWTSERPGCYSRLPESSWTRAELAELTEQTEGWPAGLYLSALSMRAGGPSPASAASFTGGDRFVSEYFRHELLSRLRPVEARFLKYTSVLDRMSGGLCDAVLETTRSAHTLEALEHRNCFVVPLDRQGEWYRYHHLFGELLRNELERSEPDTVPALNRRAMDWCIAHDLPEAAIQYGHAAGEMDTVAGLVDALALSVHYDGRMETVEEWLGWFSEDELRQLPRTRRRGSMAARADRAAGGCRAVARPGRRGNLDDPALRWQRDDRALGRHPAGAHDAERRRPARSPTPSWRWICSHRGAAGAMSHSWPAGRRACAARRNRSSEGRPHRGGGAGAGVRRRDRGRCPGTGHSSRCSRPSAEPGTTRGSAPEQLKRSSTETGLDDYSTSALAHVATARVALHEARREDARAVLARAHRLRPLLDHGLPWVTIEIGLELTRAHLALAEPGRGPHGPDRNRAGARAPPATWGRWPRTHGSCTVAWPRRPGRMVPGR